MNSVLLSLASVAAAAVSIALFPTHAVAAGLLFTSNGVLVMLWADYGRNIEPLRARADVVDFEHGRTGRDLRRAA